MRKTSGCFIANLVCGALAVLSFGGCAPSAQSEPNEERFATAVDVTAMDAQTVPDGRFYDLFLYDETADFGLYEPSDGCYLGADISMDKTQGGDIRAFEEETRRTHALYAASMQLGAAYPSQWIRSCLARHKTPVLTINPPDGPSPFQEDLLEKTAKAAGALNVPLFIQLYPLTSDSSYIASKYVDFFRKARALFWAYAPRAAMVWGVSSETAYDCQSFYPGDDAVDWAAVSITQEPGGQTAETAFPSPAINSLDYFYYSFQNKKPIMVAGLAVSHYATDDARYETEEAAAAISRFYQSLVPRYPCIKAVIYHSYNAIDEKDPTVSTGVFHNYLLTDEALIAQAYHDGTQSEQYLGEFNPAQPENPQHRLIRSPFLAYEKNGAYFIAEKTVRYDFALAGLHHTAPPAVLFAGKRYYPLDELERHLGLTYKTDPANSILTVSFEP